MTEPKVADNRLFELQLVYEQLRHYDRIKCLDREKEPITYVLWHAICKALGEEK